MAFVATETWTVSRRETFGQMWRGIWQPLDDAIAGWPEFYRARLSAAIAISVGLHIILVMALLNNGLISPERLRGLTIQNHDSALTVIDVTEKQPPPPMSAEKKANRIKSPPKGVPRKVTITQSSPLRREWSVSRIGTTASNSNAETSDSGSQAGLNGGSEGVYDPYAGASPKQQDRFGVRNLADDFQFEGSVDPALDREAFARLVQQLRQQLRRSKGHVELTVSIDRNGTVLSADVKEGQAPPQLKLFVRNKVIGQRLFVQGNSGTRTLPVIRI